MTGGGIKFSPIGKGVGGRERLTGEEVVVLLKRAKVVCILYVSREEIKMCMTLI